MSASEIGRREFLMAAAAGATLAARPFGDWRIRGSNERIRLGIIGCGTRGNYQWGRVVHNAKKHNIEVTALRDVWKPALERLAAAVEKEQKSKPQMFQRYGDLLASKEVDAVIITTPDFSHCPILIDAAKAKKDAFCEKPLSRTF